MESGPLPPHERTWRHPSEVAAEERALLAAEPSRRSTRALALTSGTLGLVAVGLLMVAITPSRSESPILLSASTTPVADASGGGRGATALASIGSGAGGSGTPASLSGTALATPIGDGRFAIVTRESLAGNPDTLIDVRFSSGRVAAGSIVTASDDAVVVALAESEPGHAIASDMPSDEEIVTVMASPPITIAYDDVETLAVEEGTAVIDDDGHLVGICSRRSGSNHVRVIEVSEELDEATSVVP